MQFDYRLFSFVYYSFVDFIFWRVVSAAVSLNN